MKKIDNKNISRSEFNFINPYSMHLQSINYEEMHPVSLYCIAPQHQSSILRRQNNWLFYLKFTGEVNDLTLFF